MNGHNSSKRNFLRYAIGAAVASYTLPGFLRSGMALAETGRPHILGAPSPMAIQVAAVPKFTNILPNPLAPGFLATATSPGVYDLRIQQVQQNLGLGGPLTTVWGYRDNAMAQARFPGPTFDVTQGTPIQVNFYNDLVDGAGALLPNPMPVDTTLDWVNPPSAGATMPVPVATHLHGGDTRSLSDGLPDQWETAAATAPVQYYQKSTTFQMPYLYDNAQESGHLWYHDHALGITRTNVYMGLAGLYFLRDANENALRTATARTGAVLPSYPYEMPLVIQDRMFNADGSLFYPDTPMAGTSAVAPSHLPEFFGDVVLVNTQAWPVMAVEPRKYRFRLLNGSDSRFYDLKLVTTANRAGPAITVIGNELGFLDRPAVPSANWVGGPRSVLSIAPGERYDIIVDFTGVRNGTRFLLVNSAAAPYPAGLPITPGTADQIMAFDVTLPLNAAVRNATVTNNTNLRPTAPLGAVTTRGKTIAATRKILLWEGMDSLGRLQTMLGNATPIAATAVPGAADGTMTYKDPVTETPKVGTWEIWEFYNCTVDAHPIHMHLVDFRILNRQAFTFTSTTKAMSDGSTGGALTGVTLARATRAPGAWEAGRKDTVQAFPGEVTRVLVNFKRAGDYVYHCHILSHEDHEMMRPYKVV